MIRVCFIVFFVFMCALSFGQDSIYGKIYGDSAVAKYIKITNTIKDISTFSDEYANIIL